MDNNTIAYCGINCATCELYIATVSNDYNLKQELSLKWGKLYNRSFEIEEMNCQGCKSKNKFFICNRCDIVSCNVDKSIEKCTQCEVYPCKRIEKFYQWQEENDTKVNK